MISAREAGAPPPDISSPSLEIAFGLPDTARSGERFIQPSVEVDGTMMRMDDVLGAGAWLITSGDSSVALADDSVVRLVNLSDHALRPYRHHVEAWLDDANATSVLVRADRYVFGTGNADRLVREFRAQAGLTVP